MILMKLLSVAALEVVILLMTNSSAESDEHFIKIIICPFQLLTAEIIDTFIHSKL